MSLAVAAVVGLAFFGYTMANKEPESNVFVGSTTRVEKETAQYVFGDAYDVQQRHISNRSFSHKQEMPSFTDVTDSGSRIVGGQPVYDLTQREYVTNKMNNLNPNPWTKVGPGIGVGPNVPAYGGFQQLFRVLPVNVNESRLTQLPGGVQGPPQAANFMGQSRQLAAKNRPDKDWSRTPGPSNAIKTAPPTHPEEVRGQRFTRKDASLVRTDDLSLGCAMKDLGQGYISTTNNALKTTDREKLDRVGNPGRMNVTDGPLAQNGMITSVRIDANERVANHGATKLSYLRTGQQEINKYKDNPGAAVVYPLNTAKKQLENNPYNHTIS